MMDKSEIAINFRLAKDKREIVNTLADLNLCAPQKIAQILWDMGELQKEGLKVSDYSSEYKPIQGARQSQLSRKQGRTRLDTDRALEMYHAGKSDAEIAAELGTVTKTVSKWRWRNGLYKSLQGNGEETVENESQTPTEAVDDAPQAVREAADGMKVQEFLAIITELLTPGAVKFLLSINGAPVNEVARINIKMSGGDPLVDIEVI